MEGEGEKEDEGDKETNWRKSKDDQVSAPLIIDPTPGYMMKEMKAVTRKFEEVSGRIPAKDRASLSGLLVFWVELAQLH